MIFWFSKKTCFIFCGCYNHNQERQTTTKQEREDKEMKKAVEMIKMFVLSFENMVAIDTAYHKAKRVERLSYRILRQAREEYEEKRTNDLWYGYLKAYSVWEKANNKFMSLMHECLAITQAYREIHKDGMTGYAYGI
jgi:hypothetical protein